jgi:hypothetical protein
MASLLARRLLPRDQCLDPVGAGQGANQPSGYKQEVEDADRAEAVAKLIPADLSQQEPSNA